MNIYEYFKKRYVKVAEEESIIKVKISNVRDKTDEKMKEYEAKEMVILSLIQKKINDFEVELLGRIANLEEFNLEKKRESAHTKNIVGESRENYIKALTDLIEKLKKLKEPKLNILIEKVDNILTDFNKKSFKDYERATFLIGKEMFNIKESLKTFSANILDIFDENKEIIESFEIAFEIAKNLDKIFSIDKISESVDKDIINFDKRLEDKILEKTNLSKILEKTKSNSEYLKTLENRENINILKEELGNNISDLRQLIDFKELTNIFHKNPKKMEIIKDYKNYFHNNFEKNKDTALIKLLEEGKLNNDVILKKMHGIKEKRDAINNMEKEMKEDEVKLIISKIKEIDIEIENIKIASSKEKRRTQKLEDQKKEFVNLLEGNLIKIKLELIE